MWKHFMAHIEIINLYHIRQNISTVHNLGVSGQPTERLTTANWKSKLKMQTERVSFLKYNLQKRNIKMCLTDARIPNTLGPACGIVWNEAVRCRPTIFPTERVVFLTDKMFLKSTWDKGFNRGELSPSLPMFNNPSKFLCKLLVQLELLTRNYLKYYGTSQLHSATRLK